MLPRGMAAERPWARFRIRIYRAEGLPTMDSGLMAKMSKVTDRTVFIDPYVQVTFAGQQVLVLFSSRPYPYFTGRTKDLTVQTQVQLRLLQNLFQPFNSLYGWT